MLASGSPANASSAASRIAWKLPSASAPRRLGVGGFAISVNGHRGGVEAELREEVPGVREDDERDDAREASQDSGRHERVRDRRGAAERARAGCNRREDRDSERSADL